MPIPVNPDHLDHRMFGALVVRHSLDAMVLMTDDGRILLANEAASALFGYSAEELICGGRRLLVDDADPEIAALAAARAARGAVRGEAWFTRRDGSRFRAELTSASFEDQGRRRIAVIIRDVTERYTLEHRQRLVTTAMDDSPQVICVIDADWTILWANRATHRISGYPPEKLIGKIAPMHRYLEAEDPDALRAINRSLASAGHWSGEVFTRRRNGEVYPLFGAFSRVESHELGQSHYITTLTDVSIIRANERKLYDITHFDPITGLPNRAHFAELGATKLRRMRRGGERGYVAMIDVDRFRDVIEANGYKIADTALQALTARLTQVLGPEHLLARHSGDTFTAILDDLQGSETVLALADRLARALDQPIVVEGRELMLTTSIGISCFPDDGESAEQLLQNAQMAMHRVKEDGGNGCALFEVGAKYPSPRNIEMAAALRRAVENNELVAYFQPIVDSSSFDVVGMEALLRWQRSDGSVTGPDEFIDIAERTGLIGPISEIVLRQACRHLLRLDRAGFPGLHCSVNLSPCQFRDPALHEHIIGIVESEGVAPQRLALEITENLLMDRPEEKQVTLAALQAYGMRIVIDDFGTGYSSFGYLKHFSVNGIKLDRMFLEDVPGDTRDEKLVAMLLSIGRELDIPVVAEGVETRRQARFLERHHCTRLQGFHVSPALPGSAFLDFLLDEKNGAYLLG